MEIDLTSGGAIAVIGMAISSLIGQWLTIKKVASEAGSRREDARLLLEQTKAEAELTKVKMESAAALLERKVDENKREVSRVAQVASEETKELKAMVKQNSTMTEEGALSAQKAYHEANQVNVWRSDIQKEIRDLAVAVKALYERDSNDRRAASGAPSTEVVDTRLVEVSKQVAQEIKSAVNPDATKAD